MLMPAPTYRSAEGDGTSVWIHVAGRCIARFGRYHYEIYGATQPEQMVGTGRCATVENWQAFRDAIGAEYGYDIPADVTPTRFWDALGIRPREGVSVPLATIQAEYDPLVNPPWSREATDRATIATRIAAADFVADYVPMIDREGITGHWDARRIAYFVVHYEPEPIESRSPATKGTGRWWKATIGSPPRSTGATSGSTS